MKRFLLFTGESYYPAGGWEDYKGSFDIQSEAEAAGEPCPHGWWHVVDSTDWRIVSSRYESYPVERFDLTPGPAVVS